MFLELVVDSYMSTEKRWGVLSQSAKQLNCWLAYTNLVGGQDEIVFDGDSMFIDPEGHRHSNAKQFKEDLLLADIPLSKKKREPHEQIHWINLNPPTTPKPNLPKPKHSELDTLT